MDALNSVVLYLVFFQTAHWERFYDRLPAVREHIHPAGIRPGVGSVLHTDRDGTGIIISMLTLLLAVSRQRHNARPTESIPLHYVNWVELN